MIPQVPRRAIIVPDSRTKSEQSPLQLALFAPDGAPVGTVKKAAAQANSTASDVAGIVADFNALLAKLRSAGVIAS